MRCGSYRLSCMTDDKIHNALLYRPIRHIHNNSLTSTKVRPSSLVKPNSLRAGRIPANTKHWNNIYTTSAPRRSNLVEMLYKLMFCVCFDGPAGFTAFLLKASNQYIFLWITVGSMFKQLKNKRQANQREDLEDNLCKWEATRFSSVSAAAFSAF